MTGSIYALSDPRTNEVRYVGKAANPAKRLQAHLSAFQLTQYRSRKNSWLRSLLEKGLKPDLLIVDSDIPAEDLNEAEKFWIAVYRGWGVPLTNGTDGGDGGAVTDPDARARIRAAHLGKKASGETRLKMSAAHQRRMADPAAREAWTTKMRNRPNQKPPPIRRGEDNNTARFSVAEVFDMRQRRAAGASLKEIAERYATSQAQVSYVVTGRTWSHVGGPIQPVRTKERLTEADVREIRRLAAQGLRQREIAVLFRINKSTVSQIINRVRRKKVR